MKRREEIELAWFSKAVQSNHRYDEKSFKEAVEWADKTMIKKACKWLINIDFDDFHFRDCDESFNNDLFVDAFRKAMQNE